MLRSHEIWDNTFVFYRSHQSQTANSGSKTQMFWTLRPPQSGVSRREIGAYVLHLLQWKHLQIENVLSQNFRNIAFVWRYNRNGSVAIVTSSCGCVGRVKAQFPSCTLWLCFSPCCGSRKAHQGTYVCVWERESCFISSQATVQEDCACHVAHCVCLQGEYYLMLRGSMSCKMDFGSVFWW